MEATVISIVPREVRMHAPGLSPDIFVLPPAAEGDFEILHVKDSFFYVYRLEGEQIRVSEPGEIVARSIVTTFLGDQLGMTENGAPGLFWLPGVFSKEEIQAKYKKELDAARSRQVMWFKELVNLADDSWQKNHLLRAISETQRDAARRLGLRKEWLVDYKQLTQCPACGSTLPIPDATVCAQCRTIINPAEHARRFAALTGAKA